MNAQKTVSLVLGSGGARGMAHIGIIRCLEDRNYSIANIAGASIGALVGGFYAAGKLDQYERWVCALERRDVLRLLDLSFNGGGLFKGYKIMEVLKRQVGDARIEDLPIEFTAVAVDIERQREIWFNDGSLFEAIRGSIAIPSVFKPHPYRGMMLVDGGVLNPVPIAPTLRTQTDLTLAVNLNGRADMPGKPEKANHKKPAKVSVEAQNTVHRAINRFIDRWWSEKTDTTEPQSQWSMLELMNRSIDTMQNTIAHMKLAAHQPDILIEIPRGVGGLFDYHLASEMIDDGYQLCAAALDRYEAKQGFTDLHEDIEEIGTDEL
ncbi:patatin-like phospholipase family protein [Saccharospirillum impatiens]|uniref:patatin-like phospholipase family protein n=1 Tax=Saccharospirillum impatiens TaxID=169438 RepID=UPI00042581C2|nr:patatin-like phospholipase family protein [Saccharospirillum impatiens]